MTEQDTREPIDVRTEAESIANLIAARRYADAFDALATAKENQPLSLQEALDRQVYSRSRESLATLRQSADYATHREDVDRLEQAVQFVRFPTGAEMAELANESQRHDVYASVIMLRGNNAARTALTTVNERSILGLRQENSTLAAADPTDVTRARPDDPATTQADESRRGTGVYDDRIVVLWTDAAGGRRPIGITRPSHRFHGVGIRALSRHRQRSMAIQS